MCIPLCRLQLAVPQNLGDLVYAAPGVDHVAGHGMPEIVHSHIEKSGRCARLVPATVNLLFSYFSPLNVKRPASSMDTSLLYNDFLPLVMLLLCQSVAQILQVQGVRAPGGAEKIFAPAACGAEFIAGGNRPKEIFRQKAVVDEQFPGQPVHGIEEVQQVAGMVFVEVGTDCPLEKLRPEGAAADLEDVGALSIEPKILRADEGGFEEQGGIASQGGKAAQLLRQDPG